MLNPGRHQGRITALLVCTFSLLAAAFGSPRALAAETPEEHHRRADIALQTLLLEFLDPDREYFRASWPSGDGLTGYWTFAQGFDALLDGVERTQGRQYSGLVETLFRAQDRRGWLTGYYDDENWMALVLIRAFDLLGDEKYLGVAKMLFQDIALGWDTSCCGANPGGIWWDKSWTQKATASNAGPVITALRLHERTGEPSYLSFAEEVYDYWIANMLEPDFQVLDHINPDGTKVDWRFTYNEGLLIGASVEFFKATGLDAYRSRALDILSFVLEEEVASSAHGGVLTDGSNSSCKGDCHAFKGIAYRYLMELYELTADERALGILEGSATAIWELARNPEIDMFSVSWMGPPMAVVSEPQMVAAVMALNIFASKAGPYPGTDLVEGRYEAENATIHEVRLEADQDGFTGWGYVTDWYREGQAVAFAVEVPGAGEYELAMRYIAGDGDATRLLAVDGETVSPNFLFPGTGTWSTYGTVRTRITLPGGKSSVSLTFDVRSLNSGDLALDHIEIRRNDIPLFLRGDCNDDGKLDISDPVGFLNYRFLGAARPACLDACDVDDNGALEITDAIRSLNFQFLGTAPAPEPPGPFECGRDPTTDEVTCEEFLNCH